MKKFALYVLVFVLVVGSASILGLLQLSKQDAEESMIYAAARASHAETDFTLRSMSPEKFFEEDLAGAKFLGEYTVASGAAMLQTNRKYSMGMGPANIEVSSGGKTLWVEVSIGEQARAKSGDKLYVYETTGPEYVSRRTGETHGPPTIRKFGSLKPLL